MWLERRVFLKLLTCVTGVAISGCGANPMLDNVADVTQYVTSGPPETDIDREAIAKLPYATIAAKVGKQQKTILVLRRIQNGTLQWLSSDGGVLVTRDGRLIQTAGFNDNLRATVMKGPELLDGIHEGTDSSMQSTRMVDVELEGVYRTLPITSTVEVIGPRRIEIADIMFDTILVREHNVAKTINWTFDNYYWVDPFDGFIWKSRQHFARTLPPVDIEVLKPAG